MGRLSGKFRAIFSLNSKATAIAGLIVVASVIAVTYRSAFEIGYYFNEDFSYLILTRKQSLWEAALYFFDPRLQWQWFRPIYGLVLWILDNPLRANEILYHLATIFFHFVNCVLVGALTWRISHQRSLGLISALLFSVFPAYHASLWWPLDSSPLAALFSLLAIGFWIRYLQRNDRFHLIVAFACYVLALFTKEAVASLLLVFLLSELLLVPGRAGIAGLSRRYLGFVLVLGVYVWLESIFQSNGMFVKGIGYTVDLHVARNLMNYVGLLASPWLPEQGPVYWAGFIIVLLLVAVVLSRSRGLIFLVAATVVLLLPVLPINGYEYRYLYIPALPFSVIVASMIQAAYQRLAALPWSGAVMGLMVTAFALQGSAVSAQVVDGVASIARQSRVPLRDFAQKHPDLPTGTLLYFVDPPIPNINLAGLALLRFGDGVSIGSTEIDQPARLTDYPLAYVVYYDGSGRQQEQKVNAESTVKTSRALPVKFEEPLELTGYEIADSTFQRGKDIVLLLYWRATGRIDRDYTIYTHLIDGSGQMVAGDDSQPKKGQLPTTHWVPGQLVVHPAIIFLPNDLTPGSGYRISVGAYYLPTMERVPLAIQPNDPAHGGEIEVGPLTIE